MPFGIYFPAGAIFGISLIFVGFALMSNGLGGFWKDKETGQPLVLTSGGAWPNIVCGVVLIMNNVLGILFWGFHPAPYFLDYWGHFGFDAGNFYFPMLGLVFGVVYLISGLAYKIKGWDDRPYGLLCLINAIVLLPMAIWDPDPRLMFMWGCWTIILLMYAYEGLTGKMIGGEKWWTKKFCFFCGIFTGIIPGMWMLSGLWVWQPWW